MHREDDATTTVPAVRRPSLRLVVRQVKIAYFVSHTTWQVSHKNRGLGRAERAPTPDFCVVNLRTLPSRDSTLLEQHGDAAPLQQNLVQVI